MTMQGAIWQFLRFISGVALLTGLEGPGNHHFLKLLKVKLYIGPTIFLVSQGPIMIGPLRFQKQDYTPVYSIKLTQNEINASKFCFTVIEKENSSLLFAKS